MSARSKRRRKHKRAVARFDEVRMARWREGAEGRQVERERLRQALADCTATPEEITEDADRQALFDAWPPGLLTSDHMSWEALERAKKAGMA